MTVPTIHHADAALWVHCPQGHLVEVTCGWTLGAGIVPSHHGGDWHPVRGEQEPGWAGTVPFPPGKAKHATDGDPRFYLDYCEACRCHVDAPVNEMTAALIAAATDPTCTDANYQANYRVPLT